MSWTEINEKHLKNKEKQAKITKAKNIFYLVIAFVGLVAFMVIHHGT